MTQFMSKHHFLKYKENNTNSLSIYSSIIDALMLFFLWFSMLHTFFSVLGWQIIAWPLWLYSVFLIVFYMLVRFFFYSWRYITILSLGIILIILFFKDFKNGLIILINDIFTLYGRLSGDALHLYQLSLNSDQFNVAKIMTSLLIGILLTLVLDWVIGKRLLKLLIFLWILVLLCHVFFSIPFIIYIHIIFLLSYLYLSVQKRYVESGYLFGNYLKWTFQMLGTLMIAFIITFGIWQIMTYYFNLSTNPASDYVQSKSQSIIHQARFENSPTNSFPLGDFDKIGPLEQSGKVAMNIIMDNPNPMYLKGFVGSIYGDNQWKTLSNELNHSEGDLFYWFETNEFTPYNQLELINQTYDKKMIGERSKVKIDVVDADRSFIYSPYGLKTKPSDIGDIKQREALYSEGFFGSKVYQYEMNTDLITHYPALANFLYKNKSKASLENYINNEAQYNQYVYRHFTQIPKDVETVIGNHLELDNLKSDSKHISYETAIEIVQQYLKRDMTYTIKPEAVPDKRDFFTHFIEDSKEGYATHFATAATLIFRYMNIPARYVEGYLMTPKKIDKLEPYEQAQITGEDSHAWTEIYIDQIGWVPIETTPAYEDMMPPVDLSDYPNSGQDDKQNEKLENEGINIDDYFIDDSQSEVEQVLEDDKDVVTPKAPDRDKNWAWMKIIIFGMLMVIFLIFLGRIMYKRYKLRSLSRLISKAGANQGIQTMQRYLNSLSTYERLNLGQVESSLQTKFNQAKHYAQLAYYGPYMLTSKDKNAMLSHVKEIEEALLSKKKWHQKLRAKYWDGLYGLK